MPCYNCKHEGTIKCDACVSSNFCPAPTLSVLRVFHAVHLEVPMEDGKRTAVFALLDSDQFKAPDLEYISGVLGIQMSVR